MEKLTRQDLFSLEHYAERREAMRREAIAHKKNRRISVGGHIRLLFEDRVTIQYQVQEMLRVERIFEAKGIQDELDAYNPLIPDGDNWKATMLIEYEDVAERQRELALLKGVEDRVYVEVGGRRVYAIADEDLERENAEKTSSVHFLRFQFDAAALGALRGASAVKIGVDHPHYASTVELEAAQRQALVADLR